jgi:hypothetical protein
LPTLITGIKRRGGGDIGAWGLEGREKIVEIFVRANGC